MECRAQCPYCWQQVEIWVDPGGAAEQRYVEDCSICCRPWQVVATVGDPEDGGDQDDDSVLSEGGVRVLLLRLDE